MRKILMLCLMLMFSSAIVSAASLDEPAEKKVTVRSEIERGKSAVERKTGTVDLIEFVGSVADILDKNQQANTDTDAFYFGVYGRAWIKMHPLIGAYEKNEDIRNKKYTASQVQFYNDSAAFYFKQFRIKQKELNISDVDLRTLFTFREEWLAEWDKKTAE